MRYDSLCLTVLSNSYNVIHLNLTEQVQYNRPLPPVPCHRERMANSSTFVNNLPLISGLPARVRKKRPHHENGDENGGYTISHDGSQGNCSISNTGSTSPLKPKPKKRTKPQLEEKSPFQLVPCINFGSEKVVTRLFLFGSSYFGFEKKICPSITGTF